MNLFQKRFEEIKKQPKKNFPAYYFQDRALAFIEEFDVEEINPRKSRQYIGSIMRVFKRKPEKAETVYRNMKGKKYRNPATYFLKVVNL